MIGNILCWIIAIAVILTNSRDLPDLPTKLLFAMGFILLGILSKAVDAYREVRTKAVKEETNK